MTTTLAPDRTAFRAALAEVADKAKDKLPECNGRVEKAVKLVLAGDVAVHADGTAVVASLSDPTKTYTVEQSVCTCQDFPLAPHGFCCHRLAVALTRRAAELLREANPAPETSPKEDASTGLPEASINPRWIVRIQGKPYVLYAGLLAMAHERGLQELRAVWTYNDAEVSLAEATAVFPFGTYSEAGDSSPATVGKKVALHWRRMSLVRAKSRCLRDALNVAELCALEELGQEVADG